jgi:hypothetical protein
VKFTVGTHAGSADIPSFWNKKLPTEQRVSRWESLSEIQQKQVKDQADHILFNSQWREMIEKKRSNQEIAARLLTEYEFGFESFTPAFADFIEEQIGGTEGIENLLNYLRAWIPIHGKYCGLEARRRLGFPDRRRLPEAK